MIKLMQRWRQQGTVQPDRIGGSKRSTLAAHAERVRALLAAEPDLTIAELRTRLAAAGIAVSRSAVDRFLAAAGLTRKKRPSAPPSRTVRTSPPPAPPGAPTAGLDPERLVFIDETWATTAMARRYGRGGVARAWSAPCPMGTGRPRPSWPRCATTA